MTAPTTEQAIEVVRALARERGVACTPVVIADRSNLVLRLDPRPIVARVAMATSAVRVGMAWLGREVEIARRLDAAGVGVTRPSRALDAGPIEREGLVVSFWELEDVRAERADPRASGIELARAHAALRALDRAAVPEWGGWIEARAVLERARTSPLVSADELRAIERAWERGERVVASARARTASFQPVHGDAHLGNVLATARGVLWTDWEDAMIGPVEWDLACLRSRGELFGEDAEWIDQACAGYAGEWDRELARELGLVRNLQVIPWLAVFAERDPALLGRMRARIAKLGDREKS